MTVGVEIKKEPTVANLMAAKELVDFCGGDYAVARQSIDALESLQLYKHTSHVFTLDLTVDADSEPPPAVVDNHKEE